MRQLVLAAVLAAFALPALAQPTAADPLATGVDLRRAGRAAEAIPHLETASRTQASDADVWLNLGLAYAAVGRFDDAERALAEAQRLAPDYADVGVARARVAFYRGDYDEADRRLAPILAAAPTHADARALQAQVAAARRAPPAQDDARWRLDLGATYGDRSKGLSSTRIGQASLSRTKDGLTLGGSVEHARQFGATDTYLEGVAANRFGYLALGGTPNAQFRPEWAIRAGLVSGARPVGAGWSAQLAVDGGHARYVTGGVWSLHPSLTVARGEAVSLTARWINVIDETDEYRTGYALRGAWRPVGRLQLSAGWSHAPESSEGVTVRVKAVSLGLAYDVSDDLTLRIDGVHEDRPAYDQDLVSLGVTRRF
ncbi:YaiO family outer membrane beta-barrel protein [Phenylobacterium sp. VNQ135]|uniref:YaiO family outer membrane beta-barrel protein n=1 Tax=Phenylobacterium sp. VNQ135 TaxID=3400922 RepID=UPI003BFC808E